MSERNDAAEAALCRLCRQLLTAVLLTFLLQSTVAAAPARLEKRPFPGSPPSLPSNVPAAVAGAPVLAKGYGKLPLTFEANLGQTDGRVRFLAHGGGYTLFLTDREAVLSLRRGEKEKRKKHDPDRPFGRDPHFDEPKRHKRDVLRISLAGANPSPRVIGLEEQPGKSNYFIGNDRSKWRTNVPHYAKVQYQDVYPGIDLVYYGNERRLEHDFVVAAGADPSLIRLKFGGAKKISTDSAGHLVLKTKGGEVALQTPIVYQDVNGDRRPVPGTYRLTGKNEAAFEVDAYDQRLALVIDPVLVYSTYLGGANADTGNGIAVDDDGSAYLTGDTDSLDFPTASPVQGNQFGRDAFVTKLSPSGSAIVYSTYLGGSEATNEHGWDVAVDAAGSAYVVGDTWSNNFPTMNPYQPCGAVSDAFVTKLSPDGAVLQYSTCLSGSYLDSARAIEVDASGFAYVAGWTESTNFPTQGAYQTTKGAGRDAFVAKLSPGGNTLVYSTYLGGGAADQANGLAIDETLKACLVGYTGSFDFPTLNAFQATRHPMEDAFVTCLTPAGDGLVYSTYLGGNNTDIGVAIAMDSAGSAFVTGLTISPDFPLSSPYQNVYRVFDAFVAKLSPTGTSLLYSTYLAARGGMTFERPPEGVR